MKLAEFAKSIPASVKDVEGALIVDGKPIKLGAPIEVSLRGESIDLHFAVPRKHWHHLLQETQMRTRMGTKTFTTFVPPQTYGKYNETMTVVQRVQFYDIQPAGLS